MAIDVDKNFPKLTRRGGAHRSRTEQRAAVEKMKKCLADGLPCKVACLESGYREDTGFRLFKHLTGQTMEQYRKDNEEKPQRQPTETSATC